jgi:hypothetical protein
MIGKGGGGGRGGTGGTCGSGGSCGIGGGGGRLTWGGVGSGTFGTTLFAVSTTS